MGKKLAQDNASALECDAREAIEAEALKLSETVKLAEAEKDKMISDFKLREAKLVEAEAVAANAEI